MGDQERPNMKKNNRNIIVICIRIPSQGKNEEHINKFRAFIWYPQNDSFIFPCRISDGNKIHEAAKTDYPLTVVYDFRFLGQYAPRIVPPFEARTQDH